MREDPSASSPPPLVDLMGLTFHALTEHEVIERVVSGAAARHGGWVYTVNSESLRQAVTTPRVAELAAQADLRVADGTPLVWASRLQGTPLPERVAGSALILSLPAAAARAGLRLFLLGGNPGTAAATAALLRERHPGLGEIGTHCPPRGFEHDPERMREIEEALLNADPALVFVGLPGPKQEFLIEALRPVLPAAWFIGCGVSFSFVSGEVARAPVWLQRVGLEWLHRLGQEPRRLFRRYVLLGVPFVMRTLATSAVTRLRGRA